MPQLIRTKSFGPIVRFSARLLCLSLILCTLTKCGSTSSSKYLERAEEMSRRHEFEQAIEAYKSHMDYRLALKDRPEWENPYFYLILIGDIQLGQDKVEEALASYLSADRQEVDRYLVADRIRSVARWYENHDRLEDAVELLNQHRKGDELLFDSMLDRVSKEIVRREDAKLTPELDSTQK